MRIPVAHNNRAGPFRSNPRANSSDKPHTEAMWQKPPPCLPPEIARPSKLPPPVDFAKVAEDASVRLELFSKTKSDNDKDIDSEHREMIGSVLEGILKIHRELRVLAVGRDGRDGMDNEGSTIRRSILRASFDIQRLLIWLSCSVGTSCFVRCVWWPHFFVSY